MKNIYFILLVQLILFMATAKSFSQQDAQYTQYMYNANIINPAYAGTKERLNISVLNRSQWTGLEGAPKTQTLNFNSPIGQNGVGAGVSVVNDNVGPISEQSFNFDFSYQIKVSNEHSLAFGLKAGIQVLDVNFDRLNLFDDDDFSFMENIDNELSPQIGTGAYYFSEDWYLGISTPNLLKANKVSDLNNGFSNDRQTFYFIGGYVFDIGSDWKLKPAALTKISSGSPVAVDVSGNFFYKEKLTLGASYRYDAAISALAGFQINDSWFIAYAYDADTTGLGNFNSGSHEIFMRFELNWFQRKNCTCSPYF